MFRVVLKIGLAAAAAWAVWSFVPIRSRTMADRWRAAGDLTTFVDRAVAEVTGRPAPRQQARHKPGPAPRPTEGHTEADRRAVDRILAERLDGS